MELEFRALLIASAAVAAFVPRDRIEWGLVSQGKALPALSLTLVSNLSDLTQQGPTDLWRGRVQVDCYGAVYASARAAADAVIGTLHGFRGGGFSLIRLDAQRAQIEQSSVDRPERISLDFITAWRLSHG